MEVKMARKERIHKEYLVDTAFLLAKQEGFENVTARKLAAKAGCSTQPIFRLYENMEDLWSEVYEKAVEFYDFFYKEQPKNCETPFVDLGMAYIKFATDEKQLFRLLFMGEGLSYAKSLYDILNGTGGYVGAEFARAKNAGIVDGQNLFTKMWIFIHGIACMSVTGDYDLDEKQTCDLLIETSKAFS